MPAKTKTQKNLMCMALAVKEGKLSPDRIPKNYRDKILSVSKSMSVEQLTDYCKGS